MRNYIHLQLRVLRYQRRKTIISINLKMAWSLLYCLIIKTDKTDTIQNSLVNNSTSHPPSTGAVVRTRTAVPGIEQKDKKEDSLGLNKKIKKRIPLDI